MDKPLFYCNFVSPNHNLANPMDEIPAIETHPIPHIKTDGVPHLADKVKRVKENMREKIFDARVDPLRRERSKRSACTMPLIA